MGLPPRLRLHGEHFRSLFADFYARQLIICSLLISGAGSAYESASDVGASALFRQLAFKVWIALRNLCLRLITFNASTLQSVNRTDFSLAHNDQHLWHRAHGPRVGGELEASALLPLLIIRFFSAAPIANSRPRTAHSSRCSAPPSSSAAACTPPLLAITSSS